MEESQQKSPRYASETKRSQHTTQHVNMGGEGCYAEPPEVLLQSVPRVCMLSNVWSQECSSWSALGRANGSRPRHLSTCKHV